MRAVPGNNYSSQCISIEFYNGKNPAVRKMMEYLSNNLSGDLAGAYIHGSLGTGEEEEYSDFDALVILKNEVFKSRRRLMKVAGKLRESLHIMYDFDPLQHHGWFVLTEADLQHYNDSYFPVILFKYSRSLLEDTGRELHLAPVDSNADADKFFRNVAASILSKLDRTNYPNNIYQLKSMLSEFMLMPALYMQACKGEGVFKKDSFQLAENALVCGFWESMREVSSIRKNWKYDLSPSERWMMTRVHPLRKYVVNYAAPHIPEAIAVKLCDKLYSSMRSLTHAMLDNCR